MTIIYKTTLGIAYCGDSLELMRDIPDNSVDLVITSPPFALRRKKSYGNVSAEKYADWFMPFAEQIHRFLKARGALF